MTYREMCTEIIATTENAEMRETAERLLASLDAKKNSKKNSAKATENANIKENILRVLMTRKDGARVGEVMEVINAEMGTNYSSNKISRMMTELKTDGHITREIVKRNAVFKIAQSKIADRGINTPVFFEKGVDKLGSLWYNRGLGKEPDVPCPRDTEQ